MDMFNVRTIARTLIAGIFVVGGWDSLQHPKEKTGPAQQAGVPVAEKVGMTTDPVELVKLSGAVQLVGGVMLALGWLPRVVALALGATLVPTTVGTHRFWEIDDPDERKTQMLHALKNASIMGGLLMTALDHGGRPSVFWITRQAAGRAGDTVSGAMEKITG
jgi:putative oxidoreductase